MAFLYFKNLVASSWNHNHNFVTEFKDLEFIYGHLVLFLGKLLSPGFILIILIQCIFNPLLTKRL